MTEQTVSLAESLALSVLKGDATAAYALADRLLEERDDGLTKMGQAARALKSSGTASGMAVWRWPEFESFCRRAGILIDLRTTGMTIHVPIQGPLRVEHHYIGVDTQGE